MSGEVPSAAAPGVRKKRVMVSPTFFEEEEDRRGVESKADKVVEHNSYSELEVSKLVHWGVHVWCV